MSWIVTLEDYSNQTKRDVIIQASAILEAVNKASKIVLVGEVITSATKHNLVILEAKNEDV